MFDEDELEQIRDERDDWQGHVDRQTVKKSRTSGKLLVGSLGASFLVVGFVLFLVVSGMVSAALMGVAGMGGFQANIDKLDGQDVSIYPALGPTAACSSPFTGGDFVPGDGTNGSALEAEPADSATTLPQLRADITDAEVPEGSAIVLSKDMHVPEIVNMEMIRISISQNASKGVGNVTLGDVSFYVTGLEADRMQAFDTEIRETYTNGTPDAPRFGSGGEFVLEGTSQGNNRVIIENASGRAHFLSFSELQLPNLQLAIEYYNSSNLPDDAVTSENFCPAVPNNGSDSPL